MIIHNSHGERKVGGQQVNDLNLASFYILRAYLCIEIYGFPSGNTEVQFVFFAEFVSGMNQWVFFGIVSPEFRNWKEEYAYR